MSDVVGKLWGFCNTLRHDGINYGDYIEQLTYLLFLKLADEKGVPVPEGCSWSALRAKSGTELLDYYIEVLRTLSRQKGILGDVFAGSLSKFREPVNLKKLIGLIDETEWTVLDVDLKAQAYEGLLQKYAAEQKGAGQYFTPREAIRCVVRCMKPDIRESPEFSIHDPACGTAGFLIGAYEWMMKQTHEGADLRREDRERLQNRTFSGVEIVQDTRRLALMNLYLHEIEANIYYGDALGEGPHMGKRYDCIMTNPPFGTKGAGEAPVREDFTVKTSNKQLNFVQHLMTVLKPGGRAAIVLPDNVLFEHAGREVRKLLLSDCDLHTILRLPIGTFTPYSPGVKANILFFEKGLPTKVVWIYDLRTNVEKVTKGHPLTDDYFRDFENCYCAKPRVETERFRRFSKKDIEDRDFDLDITWLEDTSAKDFGNLPDPQDLIGDAMTSLQTAFDSVNELASKLVNNVGETAKGDENGPYPLPTNWIWVKLGKVGTIVGGGTPRRDNPKFFERGKIPWATPTDIDPKNILTISKTAQQITEEAVRRSSAKILPIGTVLFSSRASIGKIAIAGTELATNQGFANIIPNKFLDSKYLAYGLRNFTPSIERLGSGTTYLEVAKSSLKEFQLPLAPLEEQRRIGAKIDALLAESKTAMTALEKAIRLLEKLDQSILSQAYKGRLIPQDPNDKPPSISELQQN